MSLADDAKLLLIPTGYNTSKVYSVFPTDGDGDFTYTRSGDASRVNPGGLIETVGTNIPRIDHTGGGCPTLLLEPLRTNYAINNTSLHLNSTLSNSGTITKTGNYAIAPDGTLTATRLQASATGSGYALLDVNGVNPTIDGDGGGYYISTIYVKSNTGQEQTCAFYGASSGSPKTRTITNEWTRIQFKGYRPSLSKYSYIGVALGNGSDDELDFLVWGGQTELVDSYASSLIYTEASIETRFADECNNSGNADLFNDASGVLYVEISALANDGTSRQISLSSGSSATNKVSLIYTSTSNQLQAFVRSSGSIAFNVSEILSDTTEFNKIALKYKQDDFSLYVNGIEVATDTSGNAPSGLNVLDFDDADGTSNFYGKVKDLRYFDRALTDEELTELTQV